MSTVKVKICGIKNERPLRLLTELPVDYVGFVFAESKRQVTADKAAALVKSLNRAAVDRDGEAAPHTMPETVGVFVNPTITELDDVLAVCPLDVVQLHGNETPEFCEEVRQRYDVRVFKVFSVSSEVDDVKLVGRFAPYAKVIDALMLDTYDPVYGGGSGVPFRWSVISEAKRWCKERGLPLIVAGGLNADNVQALIEQYAPDGVDISSGVETDGEKDENKMRQFVGRVKS